MNTCVCSMQSQMQCFKHAPPSQDSGTTEEEGTGENLRAKAWGGLQRNSAFWALRSPALAGCKIELVNTPSGAGGGVSHEPHLLAEDLLIANGFKEERPFSLRVRHLG